MPIDPGSTPGVVFLPIHGPSWNEMHWMAQELAAAGLARPLMLVTPPCGRLPRAQGDGAHLEYRELAGVAAAGTTGPGQLLRRLALRWGGPRAVLPWDKARYRVQLDEHLRQLEEAVQGFAPVLAVLTSDRHFGWELPMVGLCRRLGLKMLLPPISYPGDQDDLTGTRRSERFDAEPHAELRRRFPGQHTRDRLSGRRVWYYEPAAMLAAHEAGLLPPRPWALGSGGLDLMLVDGEGTRDRLVAAGADQDKIVVSGHRAHDDLFAGLQRRAELRAELDPEGEAAAGAKWLVVSLPPLGEHNICGWDRHWEEMRFLGQVLAKAAREGVNVLVSLHPKMDPARYGFLRSDYGLALAERSLAEIMPAADIFVAPQGSTTIQWAVLCGLPAIALDFYGLELTMYGGMDGVRVIGERERLTPEIQRLVGDEEYFQALAAAQRREGRRLSPFDGKCGQRTLYETVRLLGSNRTAHPQAAARP